jgi:hypothetical protein
MYGNFGGYGGMYGGGMYGGMPGPGMPGDPNNPESLTHRFNMSTQATFQMLEGIVGAFGGFAQMLESTYMATHSSFFGKRPHPPSNLIFLFSSGCHCLLLTRVRALSCKPWWLLPSSLAICETRWDLCWASSP